MLIDQQQKPSETLQEYVQRFSDLLLKSSGLLLHQAKDLVHIMHFIRNLHNQKLQHCFRQKPHISQKCHYVGTEKGCRIKIIEGLHNHDSGHIIHNIYPSQNDKSNKLVPCHACKGPHFIKNCEETTCLRCKPNLDSHMPSKCPRKCHSN